jgi:SAM-dependent MidA family methyltransferase
MSLPDLIRAEIARRGPIPFRDFMDLALYHPEHGYYTSGRAAIGRAGDFFTNVSVGPLFGRLLARQFAEMWELLDRPRPFVIVEQGAHRGDLAHDVLTGLRELAPECFDAVEIYLIEPASLLAEAQRARLDEFAPRVRWHPDLATLPGFTGVHFSNELLDAFPVHLVRWTGCEWVERHVAAADCFAFTDAPLSTPELAARTAALPAVDPGYTTELNLAVGPWLRTLADRLQRGFVLAIDYGFSRDEYYRPDRCDGTLSGYAAHRRESNLLARPGEIDLTAHVDFTTVAEEGEKCGLHLAGYADQNHFIIGLSQLHFRDEAPVTPAAQKELRALQTLMHPTLMGRAFRALCLSKGAPGRLTGFQFAADPRVALGLPPTPPSAAAPYTAR